MHNQALEFISVLKSLIEDTVNKGKQLQELKKEQTVVNLQPEDNYHYSKRLAEE